MRNTQHQPMHCTVLYNISPRSSFDNPFLLFRSRLGEKETRLDSTRLDSTRLDYSRTCLLLLWQHTVVLISFVCIMLVYVYVLPYVVYVP